MMLLHPNIDRSPPLFRRRSGGGGFTLIEMLVVVTIIALLTTVGLISYNAANKKARNGKRQADMEQLRSALVLYRTDNGSYPATIDWTSLAPIASYITSTSLKDPQPSSQHAQYTYTPGPGNATFRICAVLEEVTPSDYCLTNP